MHVVLVVIDLSASACLVMDCVVFCRRVQTAAHKFPLADCIHYWLISLYSSDFFISSVIFPSRCLDSRPRLRSVIFDGGVSCVYCVINDACSRVYLCIFAPLSPVCVYVIVVCRCRYLTSVSVFGILQLYTISGVTRPQQCVWAAFMCT